MAFRRENSHSSENRSRTPYPARQPTRHGQPERSDHQVTAHTEHRFKYVLCHLGQYFLTNFRLLFLSVERIANLENTVQVLRTELADSQQKTDRLTKVLFAHQQKHQCESLYADGHVMDAAQVLLEIARTAGDEVKADEIIMEWLSGEHRLCGSDEVVQSLLSVFTRKCIIALESFGDEASETERQATIVLLTRALSSMDPPIARQRVHARRS